MGREHGDREGRRGRGEEEGGAWGICIEEEGCRGGRIEHDRGGVGWAGHSRVLSRVRICYLGTVRGIL